MFGLVLVAPESPPGLATDLVRDWYGNFAEKIRRQGGPESVYDVWVYSNCSAPRALLLAHGGYDESYRWAMFEDTDFAFRLWKAGIRFRLEPEATVYQVYSKSSEHLIAGDAPRLGVGEIHLCRKQPGFRPYARLGRHDRRFTGAVVAGAAVLRHPVFAGTATPSYRSES